MKNQILFLLVNFVVIFSSCAKKIDGTSEENMKNSIEKIKSSLSDNKRGKFEESLQLIIFSELDFEKLMKDGETEELTSDIKSELDGMTADDVIKKGDIIKTKIERRKSEQAKQVIKKLYEKKVLAAENKEKLKYFEVKQSRFYKKEFSPEFIEPMIELTVKNGTKHAISRVYFKGTLASPNRSVPWIEDEFSHTISGGIEPGEEMTWEIFSLWDNIDVPKDAILIVDVLKLDGPDGKELYSIENFDEDNKERLKELLEDYPEFVRK